MRVNREFIAGFSNSLYVINGFDLPVVGAVNYRKRYICRYEAG